MAGIIGGAGSGSGDVLVLPAGSFRSTPLWAGGAAVLDPAPRLLDARVLVPGDLLVGGAVPGGAVSGGAVVAGEGDRARRATEALLRGEDPRVLTDLGVRWVLDERTSAGPRGEAARTLRATTTRFSDPELTLYELGVPNGPGEPVRVAAPPPASEAARTAVLGAHAGWLLVMALAGAVAVRSVRRR